jgi:hypothetical protein
LIRLQVRIIFGDGGEGEDYTHIHMQILANDGRTLLNFVDAFCR